VYTRRTGEKGYLLPCRLYNLCLIYFNVHNIYKKSKNARKIKLRKKEEQLQETLD
jgi:hypothetical protein